MKRIIPWSLSFLTLFMTSPVFAGGDHAHESHGAEVATGLSYSSIIVPLGIATLLGVFITLTLGLVMHKNRKLLFPWHRRSALTTGVLALTHASLVIFFH